MFFPKLRRRAKWVFLLLAIAFAIGFVAFGVGTGVGGTSIGDVLRDLIGRQSTAGSLEDVQKKAQENPKDADAQLAYANGLQARGRTQEAIAALEAYTYRPRRPRLLPASPLPARRSSRVSSRTRSHRRSPSRPRHARPPPSSARSRPRHVSRRSTSS
jgi:hypothetical protein